MVSQDTHNLEELSNVSMRTSQKPAQGSGPKAPWSQAGPHRAQDHQAGAEMTVSALSERFLAQHNLSAHPSLTRMGIEELKTWYEAVAYTPIVAHGDTDVSTLDLVDFYRSLP